ncbi:FadR/GntR family transcriptional regulator [Phytoactinopolyspora limicola]|uniref:FadR/GntR family transcriptional regulator n=1 Tax=Phytoactinopolyspora limicola TaxID=2715536 RepID=UPI001407C517|nr:GntR family transcriptional regulator [Phytoactinopolyspora limicola]
MTHGAAHVSRMHAGVFAPLGDDGRATLVERRIAQGIRAGVLNDGQKLPNEFELAKAFGVAVVTVREALGSLREQGLITTRRGRGGGSFVSASRHDSVRANEQRLLRTTRVALNDLAAHYRAVAAACAELACLRAGPEECDVLLGILDRNLTAPPEVWRSMVTDVQLELAALSRSARLTREHMALQQEIAPLLSLQDDDEPARRVNHELVVKHVNAIRDGAADTARSVLSESVEYSVIWLVNRRRMLLEGQANGTGGRDKEQTNGAGS